MNIPVQMLVFLFLIFSFGSLMGCGQKGDLYLPEDVEPEEIVINKLDKKEETKPLKNQ